MEIADLRFETHSNLQIFNLLLLVIYGKDGPFEPFLNPYFEIV